MELNLRRAETFTEMLTRKLSDGQIRRPLKVSIDVCSTCNLSCSYCYQRATGNTHANLSLAILERLASELVVLGTVEVVISGGEPTLHPDFKDIISMFKKRGFILYILSNGTRPDALMNVVPILDSSDCIQISLDAPHDYEYRTRSKDALSTAALLTKTPIPVVINSVANRENFRSLISLIPLLRNHGVKTLNVNCVYPFDLETLAMCLPSDVLYSFDNEMRRFCSEHAIGYNSGLFSDAITMIMCPDTREIVRENLAEFAPADPYATTCEAGQYRCHISSSGDVYPCVFAAAPVFLLGNLLREQFNLIWEKAVSHPMVRGRQLAFTKCGKCIFFDACRGGCPGIAQGIRGNFNEADPRCTFEP